MSDRDMACLRISEVISVENVVYVDKSAHKEDQSCSQSFKTDHKWNVHMYPDQRFRLDMVLLRPHAHIPLLG